MAPGTDNQEKSLPPPWDRIFSLATRTFVWGLLIAVLWILSPFLLLIFLTFVFAYIQAHGVDGLAHRIRSRPLRVVIVGLVFLGTLFATGFTLAPQVMKQGQTFWQNRDTYIAQADAELNKFLAQWPAIHDSLLQHQNQLRAANQGSFVPKIDEGGEGETSTENGDEAAGKPGEQQPAEPGNAPKEDTGGQQRADRESGASQDPGGKPGDGEPADRENAADGENPADGENGADEDKPREPLTFVADLFQTLGKFVTDSSLAIGQSVLGYASAFLLALLFSFLIVLDLPKIRRGVTGLARTRVGFIYDEVADNISGFGRVLGRALEAQLLIAVVNTMLTAIGVWMMGLPNMLVLSAIVFFCSFIPVAGTFISSTPICLVALQQDGVTAMLLAILLIAIIHAIETYILNPQIYGHHMHMNPVVVLIVLTVGGKLFGVWGLLLGIPIVNYIWRHAIRFPEQKPSGT